MINIHSIFDIYDKRLGRRTKIPLGYTIVKKVKSTTLMSKTNCVCSPLAYDGNKECEQIAPWVLYRK